MPDWVIAFVALACPGLGVGAGPASAHSKSIVRRGGPTYRTMKVDRRVQMPVVDRPDTTPSENSMRTLVAPLVAAVLLVSGCASGSSADSSAGSGNGKVQTITVAVKGGKVVPPTHREKVPQGDTVRLVVTTDSADEVHVHGYDLKKDVAAGKTGTIEFVADQSGLFEVELEAAGLQLLQLEVQ